MINLNLTDIDMLKEVANIGTGNAATSLSNLINQRISMSVPSVKVPEFKNLADHIGGSDTLISGLLINLSGDVTGLMMYLMKEKSACTLSNKLLGKNKKSFCEFEEMDYSMLTEIGNILMSSYLTALSSLMDFKIIQSVPSLCIDMAGAILSVPAIEFGKVYDRVLFIESKFRQISSTNEDLSGYFMLIPEVK